MHNNKVTQIIANKVYGAENIKNTLTTKINIKFEYTKNNLDIVDNLYELCKTNVGEYPIVLHMLTSQSRIKKIISNDDTDDIGVDTETLSGYLDDTSGNMHTKEYSTLGIADLKNQYWFQVQIAGTAHQSFELDEIVLTYRETGVR